MINIAKPIDDELLAQLEAHGFHYEDGIPRSHNDLACQALIDGYDPLPAHKRRKIRAIRREGLRRIQEIFPIADFDELRLVRQIFLSIAPAARQPTADMQRLLDLWQAAQGAIAQINAATTAAEVDAVTPAWPT